MDYCKIKFKIVLGILTIGMLSAVLFHAWQGWYLGKGYPYNTFLSQTLSFTDGSDIIFVENMPDPYTHVANDGLPLTYFSFRLLALLPLDVALIIFLFSCLAGLTLLLISALENIVENPWLRVGASLLLIGLSYPILFCVDRGNTEILTMLCVASSIFFFSRGRYLAGSLWLLPALCWKPYMAFFLILLVRQRQWTLVAGTIVGFVVVTAFCAHFFAGSAREVWDNYLRMMASHQADALTDRNLEESSSPWFTYKIGLMIATDLGFITPVNFEAEDHFIATSYSVYAGGIFVLAAFLTIYTWLIEKDFFRCASLSLLFVSMAIPASVDYRLVYACIALTLLILIKGRRTGDYLALVLIALVLIPKKFIFLSFPNYPYPVPSDISIQVILNPLFMLAALGVLIYSGCQAYDPRWTRLRLMRFLKSLPYVSSAKLPLMRPQVTSR